MNFYRFKVVGYDREGNVTDVRIVSTHTKGTKQEYDLNEDLTSTTIVSKKSISILWNKLQDVDQYEVYRDGILLTTVKNASFTDNNVSPDHQYNYEIKFVKRVTKEEEQEIIQNLQKKNVKLSNDEYQKLLFRPYSIIKLINTKDLDEPGLSSSKIISPNSQYNHNIAVRYTTFIPDTYVEDPWYDAATWGTGIKYFGGDSRGFNNDASTFRTRTQADTDFCTCSNTPYTNFNKTVQETRAYDENYNLIGTKTASPNASQSIWLLNSDQVNYHVTHDIKNPYTFDFAGITYYYTAQIQSDGSFWIYGKHDRAPSHEMYIMLNGYPTTIFNDPNEGFEYLVSNDAGMKSFNVSN
jgi:hypothetical protein